jgi:hypothetical protein
MWRKFLGKISQHRSRGGVTLATPSTGVAFEVFAPVGPRAGLVNVYVSASSVADRPAEVILRTAAGEEVYRRRLELVAENRLTWVAFHGHLLGDGEHAFVAELVDLDGAQLARKTFQLFSQNRGDLARSVAESLRHNGVPLVIDLCGSNLYDYKDRRLAPWFDREPEVAQAHIRALLERGEVDVQEAEALRHFVERGFLIIPDLLDADELGALNAAMDDAVAAKHEGYEWGSSQRLHNLHEVYPAVRGLWLHPRVLHLLDVIFGAPARPCQSLSYVFGSQQDHHQDTIHLTPFPAGYMCGVWTALEDVQPSSGELVVYPGSHRLDRVYRESVGLAPVENDWTAFGDTVVERWRTMLTDGGFQLETYRPKAGTVLIWHENLMHAGSVRQDLTKSRKSIVCHYFAEGVVGYYDSSAMPGSMQLDERG